MIFKEDKYRRNIYENFAKLAKYNTLKWLIAHGIEGYPSQIGRDLDIACDGDKHTSLAISLFIDAAKENPATKWIIMPNPIWGKRVLAISDNYEVAELHILQKMVSGLISLTPDFDNFQYIQGIFPVNETVTTFKSLTMSMLGGSKKVIDRINEQIFNTLPTCLQQIYLKIKANKDISIIDKIKVYTYYTKSPVTMIENLLYTIIKKIKSYSSPTTPIIYITNISNDNLKILKNDLGEIFLDILIGDNMSKKQIKYNQARQRLILLTKQRKDIKIDAEFDTITLCIYPELLDIFAEYNKIYYNDEFTA
ncbi:MAG: hypothetical protein LBG80_10570 [Bacteroidales bacterium]|jgi:hypothetical protein|nr:hypothetical protein [Bacteroidales bacterium]